MAGVTISSAVRTNLLSLQNISSQQSTVQNRLATGKKVNSALDNATSFFTASSFSSRASSLSSLLDSVSTGVQTLQAANNGLTSITSLVNQLRSTAQQALQSTSAYSSQAKVTSTSVISGATAADLRGVGATTAGSSLATNALTALTSGTRASSTSSASFASQIHDASQASATSSADFSTLTNTTAAAETGSVGVLTGLTDDNATPGSGSTLIIGDGASSATFTFDSTATAGQANKFASVSDLTTKLAAQNIKVSVAFDGASSNIQVKATSTSVAAISVGGTGATTLGLAASATRTDGSKIRVTDSAGNTKTLYKDTTGQRADSFNTAGDITTKLGLAGVNATATLGGAGGTKLVFSGTNANNLTIDNGANNGAVLGFTATAAAYTATAASTLTIGDGSTSKTYTFDSSAAAGDATHFNSIGDLNTKLAADGVKVKASNVSGNLKLAATDYTSTLSVGGSAQAGLGLAASTAGVAGSVLTVADGTTTKSYTYDSLATSGDAGSFKDIADLNTKLSNDAVKATATAGAGGNLNLAASTGTTTLAVSGTAQSGLGLKTSIAPTVAPGALDGKSLTFATSGGKSTTINFGDPATTTGAIKSLDDLNAKLADAGLSAALDSTGNLAFTTTSQTASQTFTVSGSATTGQGANFTQTVSTAGVRGGSGADTRDSLVTQFNGLLNQIDTVAKDSNFNGLNLLNGDTLSLIFNETNTSKLDVNGTSANSTGLGLATVSASNFNDGNGINSILSLVDKAKSSLATQASKFGSNLAVVQTRQDFTKNTINTLQTGSDNLVNADLNEEATNLLSLNTSQSLAQQALSLANSSQQSVLQLLR